MNNILQNYLFPKNRFKVADMPVIFAFIFNKPMILQMLNPQEISYSQMKFLNAFR
jgi:hypothetical protein